MKNKFYLTKVIAAVSIALCSGSYVSFANYNHDSSQIDCSVNSRLAMPNPVSILTEEEALKIAEKLGDGQDMGSWRTMSGEEFMKWWRSCHKNTDVSLINSDSSNIMNANRLSNFLDNSNSKLVMPNPVSILTEEEALKIAEELGNGQDMGSWRTMSGEEFMRWWRSCHKDKMNVSLVNVDSYDMVDVNGLSYFVDDANSCARLIGLSKNFDQNFIGKPIRIESSVSYGGKNYCVTSIDDSCFEGCSDFTSIIIPSSIEKIGTKAFAASSVRYVIFENDSKINSIGESAFENSSIEFIALPESLTFIDRSAFSNCENLSVLIINNPELNFSANTFNNCINLSHIFVPCNFKNKDIGYSGLKIEDSNFDIMKCSYSKFGLANQEKVASGIIHWDHKFSDWTKVENEDSKKRTCALCNLAEISVDNSEKDTTSL